MSQTNETAKHAHGGEAVVEQVELNPAGQLVVHIRGCGEPVVDARLARCFPWSLPDGYISVRDADGKEITLLQTLDGLDDASRQVVEKELADKVFNPKIRRIVEHRHEFGVTSITAETDRGQVTFQIRSRDDIRILSPTRGLFRDADGNTYEMEDLNALDAQSRKWLQDHF
ncbi:MAG TPA: DUF1854 domain-containing protein [Phycisphaerae bacterium]|nr:DUF1854 domain-containing protein [Phycisphaerae bacterium]